MSKVLIQICPTFRNVKYKAKYSFLLHPTLVIYLSSRFHWHNEKNGIINLFLQTCLAEYWKKLAVLCQALGGQLLP